MNKPFEKAARGIADGFRPEELLELLGNDSASSKGRIGVEFASWHVVIVAMPLASEIYSFLYNWLCDVERLYRCGELGVAQYELQILLKKLKRLGIDEFCARQAQYSAS